MSDDKRRLFLELQQEYIKTPPGSGRDELRRKMHDLAREIGRGDLELADDLHLDDERK